MSQDDQHALQELQRRFSTLLPEGYQDRYEDLQPTPMGSAGVRYGEDGQVAWDQMWGSFCDLAMAGGPPHKGKLLEPARPEEIDADRAGYATVVAEICRGIGMVTDLTPIESPRPGWIGMECGTAGMAAWLLRAITIENVAVRADGAFLELPAGTRLSSAQGDQERHHGDRQDHALLGRPHVGHASTDHRGPARRHERRVTAHPSGLRRRRWPGRRSRGVGELSGRCSAERDRPHPITSPSSGLARTRVRHAAVGSLDDADAGRGQRSGEA